MRTALYHPREEEFSLDRILAALADPIRRNIATRMHREGALMCGQLVYPIAKSTLSHHLKVLRESGIMHTEILGTHRRITLRIEELDRRFPGLLAAVGVTAPVPAGLPRHPAETVS